PAKCTRAEEHVDRIDAVCIQSVKRISLRSKLLSPSCPRRDTPPRHAAGTPSSRASTSFSKQDVDGRDNPRIRSGDGHDSGELIQYDPNVHHRSGGHGFMTAPLTRANTITPAKHKAGHGGETS